MKWTLMHLIFLYNYNRGLDSPILAMTPPRKVDSTVEIIGSCLSEIVHIILNIWVIWYIYQKMGWKNSNAKMKIDVAMECKVSRVVKMFCCFLAFINL